MRMPTKICMRTTLVFQHFFNSYTLGEMSIMLWPLVNIVPFLKVCIKHRPGAVTSLFFSFLVRLLHNCHDPSSVLGSGVRDHRNDLSWVMSDDGLSSWSPFPLNTLPYTCTWRSLGCFCRSLWPLQHAPRSFDISLSRDVYSVRLYMQIVNKTVTDSDPKVTLFYTWFS